MSCSSVRAGIACLLLVFAGWGQAQESPAPDTNDDLPRRLQELEKTVRQLQQKQAPAKTPAAVLPTPTDPDTVAPRGGSAESETLFPTALPSPESGRQPEGANLDSDSSPGAGRAINLERRRTGEDPGFSPSYGLPPGEVAGWNNGFYIQSPDQRFVFRITGQVQSDYRTYTNDNDRTDTDTFLIRRARFGLEATLLNYYEFRFLPDFGNGQSLIQDAYMNIHYWDFFQVEAGKFKQPFSYEQLIQDRYVPTMERSLIDQLVPARDQGIMVHGQNLLRGLLDYYFAVSNGVINGNGIDPNNNKDINGRISLSPFSWAERTSPIRFFSLGVSGSFGNQNQPVQPNQLVTPLGVRWFVFNPSVLAYGVRDRWSPEASYFYGPLGFATQYFHLDERMLASATGTAFRRPVPVTATGWYVLTSLLLTGEKRTGYSQAIGPLRPFDLRSPFAHPGAWELVGRVSRLHLGNDVFLPGTLQLANPATNAPGATEMTLGFNWYLNRKVRVQCNWERAWFDSGVQLGIGPAGKLAVQDTLATRLQLIF